MGRKEEGEKANIALRKRPLLSPNSSVIPSTIGPTMLRPAKIGIPLHPTTPGDSKKEEEHGSLSASEVTLAAANRTDQARKDGKGKAGGVLTWQGYS